MRVLNNSIVGNEGIVEAIHDIIGWHYKRNLIHGSDDKNQFLKLVQESGELADNLLNHLSIKDDIGDMIVVLINLMERNNISASECFTLSKRCAPQPRSSTTCNSSLSRDIVDYLHFESRRTDFHEGISASIYLDISADMGVLSDKICKGEENLYIFIGNIFRRLVVLAECHTLTIESCLQQAWNDIKDRKGMMVDGVFVKEADFAAEPGSNYTNQN